MEFHAYPSIPNAHAHAFVDTCRRAVPPDEQWLLVEKIHGCNFALYALGEDSQCVRAARRGGFLDDRDVFHGANVILNQYTPALRALHRALGGGAANVLSVHGELFGGLYPHDQVPQPPATAKARVKPVQKGVYYAPDHRFMAFDVAWNGVFLPWHDAQRQCAQAGLPFTPLVQVGSLDTLLAFNVDAFETQVPAALGLPRMADATKRVAEGVVLRPAREFAIPTLNGPQRALIKLKAKAFREVTGDVASNKEEVSVAAATLDPTPYVNDARLRALLSKEEPRTFKHKGDVFALLHPLIADIDEELQREHPGMAEDNARDRRALRRVIGDAVEAYLASKVAALVDGTF